MILGWGVGGGGGGEHFFNRPTKIILSKNTSDNGVKRFFDFCFFVVYTFFIFKAICSDEKSVVSGCLSTKNCDI